MPTGHPGQLIPMASPWSLRRYTDDVSFLQGVRRSGHVLCLLFTVCLYALLVLYYSGASMWLNEQAHYFKVMIFTM